MSDETRNVTSDDPYWDRLPKSIQDAIFFRPPGSIPYSGHGVEYMANLDDLTEGNTNGD